jgi:trimeric autotransporter adhesin
MSGGAGDDTYRVDNAADSVVEAASEGTDTVQSTITFTLAANVEHLTLTGTAAVHATGNGLNNTLTGNSAANTLTGGAGDDTLNGGAGADTMVGGSGNDSYVVDSTSDVVTEATGEGVDAVSSSVTHSLAAQVENLTLTGTGKINGTGNALDNLLVGNGGVNTLTGGAGHDKLDGGLGADKLVGNAGDDTYVVEVSNDTVTEAANEGTDTVRSSITWTLGNNVENLALTGAAAINGTGNTLANVLTGNAGANALSGLAGNDTYDGGAGNDTLTDNHATSNDVYRWGLGLGNDAITDAGGSDRIEIGAGVALAQVTFTRATNDLVIGLSGAADTLTIKNWYSVAANRIEEIRLADGSTINPATAAPLSAGATESSAARMSIGSGGDGDRQRIGVLVDAMAGFHADDGAAAGVATMHVPPRPPLQIALAVSH